MAYTVKVMLSVPLSSRKEELNLKSWGKKIQYPMAINCSGGKEQDPKLAVYSAMRQKAILNHTIQVTVSDKTSLTTRLKGKEPPKTDSILWFHH